MSGKDLGAGRERGGAGAGESGKIVMMRNTDIDVDVIWQVACNASKKVGIILKRSIDRCITYILSQSSIGETHNLCITIDDITSLITITEGEAAIAAPRHHTL